ncbi:hypothetical protein Dimus_038281 [Dionaea muscipula]
MHSYRVDTFDPANNDQALLANLDDLEDRREVAALHLAAYQQRVARYYNIKVRPRHFQIGDLVLRDAKFEGGREATGKLACNWEGPYQISEVLRPGTYRLKALDGRDIARTWNAKHLRQYYQ